MALTPDELRRKLVHVGAGGLAFLLRDLSWGAAITMAGSALLFNWQLLPRVGGLALWRGSEHAAGYARGILMYPAAVLALILAFPGERRWMAAALWAMLACGDGMASLIGQAAGGPRLPWNETKTWSGSLAYFLFGGLGASTLAAWTLGLPFGAALSPRMLGVTLPLALLCALVESAPTTIDDNVSVPLVGALMLPLLAQADLLGLVTGPHAVVDVFTGFVVSTAVARLARLARAIDGAGALSAIVIGTLITLGLGLPAFATLLSFAVVASAVTRLGYRTKAARGIAEEKGGERGWRHAWANGGVAVFLALLAGASPEESRSLLTLAYAASVAAGAADTSSSEIGKAFGRGTVSITSLRAVPTGTAGGVSLVGTLAGGLAATVVALVGAALDLYSAHAALLVAAAGLLGSLAESVVGGVAERKGWMGHHLRNVFNTAVGAFLAAALGWLARFLEVAGACDAWVG